MCRMKRSLSAISVAVAMQEAVDSNDAMTPAILMTVSVHVAIAIFVRDIEHGV